MATQKTIISSDFEDTISSSVLIRSGPPAVYPMTTKKEKFGSLTRMTVGKKDEKKPNKTILLVGETGAGKSALINALVNYSMGMKWEDGVWFHIVEKEKSQTEDVMVYQIFGFEGKTLPYSLTIIDTPGFGDTRGTEQNVVISQRLFDLFGSEDGVHEVHAVGLVMKASENRLSDQLMYVFDSVMSLFGKNIEENIVALITHSDGMPPKNALKALEDAKVKCSKNNKNQFVHFVFNNQQSTQRTDENEFGLETAWRIAERGLRQFTSFLKDVPPKKQAVRSVLQTERIRQTACIQNLRERIRFTELKQRDVKQAQQALDDDEEMNKNQVFSACVTEVYKDVETIGAEMCRFGFEEAVCCTICKENCHYPGCTMASKPEHCEVMADGSCTSCTGRCPASDHVKNNWRYVIRTRAVQITDKTMKQKYDAYKETDQGKPTLLEILDKEMKKLTAEKSQLVDKAYTCFKNLDQIAKNISPSTYVHLDFLIKKMKENGDTDKLQDLEEIERQMDDGIRAVVQDRMRNIPSAHQDTISSSVLIRPGPPAVYQLTTKKEKFGSLTRMTVGEKDGNKTNKTILLVGETGTGKSTLINTLVNYSMGVKWEDGVWFQIVEEKEKKSQTESQTSDVMVYQIFGFEGKTLPYSLTIIDTPGFGDTRGIEEDDIISMRLLDLFRTEDGVHEVHAVGLVIKASENRLSDQLMYVFDSVMSLFGKNVEKNIVALVTHSNGKRPENALEALNVADIKCSRDEMNQPVYFLFDNEQQKQRDTNDQDVASSKYSWYFTNDEISRFTNFVAGSQSQTLQTTVEVLNKRIRLAACIQNLQERISLTELKQTEIRQIQEALKMHEEEMKKNQNFTVEVDEAYKEKEDIDGRMWGLVFYQGAVTCTVCEENCHHPGCTMAWKPEHCKVIKKGRCTVCTNKCPVSDHVKEKWRYVNKTRKVSKTMEDMKKKYESSKKESQSKSTILENLGEEMKKLTAERSQLLDEAYQHVVRLEEIALNADSVSVCAHLDFLIEKIKEEGDKEKVQKLNVMKSREDEGTRSSQISLDKLKALKAKVAKRFGKLKK